MPSTHSSIHYHIVFSTKERRRFIESQWIDSLHSYLGGIVRSLGGIAEIVGGVEDHVHLLMGLRPSHRLSDVVRDIKSASSSWIHEELYLHRFSWQIGYGAFTVGARQRGVVHEYIANQAEHHRVKSFEEEYREMLVEHGVEFDEKYLW